MGASLGLFLLPAGRCGLDLTDHVLSPDCVCELLYHRRHMACRGLIARPHLPPMQRRFCQQGGHLHDRDFAEKGHGERSRLQLLFKVAATQNGSLV